ncbi:MAG: hypothetical protein ABSG30_02240 [Steroidobacteraceae bacterium]
MAHAQGAGAASRAPDRGRKLACVLPLRLYLTISVVFFLLLQLAAAPGNVRVVSAFHRALNDGHTSFTIVDLGFGKAVRNAGGSLDCDLRQSFCNRIKERLLQQPGESSWLCIRCMAPAGGRPC